MKVAWSGAALDDLERIRKYVTVRDARAASKIALKIGASVAQLTTTPWVGRAGRVANSRELVVENLPYIVAYRVLAEVVEVLRVLHTSRRWPESV